MVKTTVFLTDMADYAAFNAVYIEVLGPTPAGPLGRGRGRLPLGALVEIEAWAYGPRAAVDAEASARRRAAVDGAQRAWPKR